MRFDDSTTVVRLGADVKHLARQLASEIFIPNIIRTYSMPHFLMPYVMSSFVRFGSSWHT